METLCFYISDYGFGHAARAIALIRELVSAYDDLHVIAKTSGPLEFTRRSLLHPRVCMVERRNDPDVVLTGGRGTVDRAKTREAFLEWAHTWDDYVSRERAFCREHHVDLVVSDIAPQPFVVAEELGIPGLAVSNFSWDTIYGHLFPDLEAVELLREAYRSASYACILPFEIGMETFPRSERVGLVSRQITVSREDMRRRTGIAEDDFLVFVGPSPELSRQSPTAPIHIQQEQRLPSASGTAASGVHELIVRARTTSTAGETPRMRFLVPSGTAMPGALAIPASETESQNWIGMCDCVVVKCGYSSVSEAVQARVPLFVWKRDGFIEDEAIAAQIERLGIGQAVSGALEGIDRCDGRDSIRMFKENYDTLERQYSTDGSAAVLRVVGEMIG